MQVVRQLPNTKDSVEMIGSAATAWNGYVRCVVPIRGDDGDQLEH